MQGLKLLHTAITFYHFFAVSLWVQTYLFRKSYPSPVPPQSVSVSGTDIMAL